MRSNIVAILMAGLVLPVLRAEDARPPNIILILTDDSDDDGARNGTKARFFGEIMETPRLQNHGDCR